MNNMNNHILKSNTNRYLQNNYFKTNYFNNFNNNNRGKNILKDNKNQKIEKKNINSINKSNTFDYNNYQNNIFKPNIKKNLEKMNSFNSNLDLLNNSENNYIGKKQDIFNLNQNKKRNVIQLKNKFYNEEKNKKKFKSENKNLININFENEKIESEKNKILKGLIFYSELKKLIDITDKFIYNNKFCILTENTFDLYKNIDEFISFQKPYFSIMRSNIKNVSKINISNRNSREHLICFGIKYQNIKNKDEVLFLASEHEKLVFKWIKLLNKKNKNS